MLSHLNSSQAAALLISLPAGLRADVAQRMASLDQISPEIIFKIAGVIGQKLKALGEFSRESYGGVRAVAEMLNRLDSGRAAKSSTTSSSRTPTWRETIRHLMFVFEDLLLIDPLGLKEVLGKVDRKLLTMALKGTSEQLRNHILSCMSQRGADMLREDMDALGPVKIKEVEAAQQQIIAMVRQLEAGGRHQPEGRGRGAVCRLRCCRPDERSRRAAPWSGGQVQTAQRRRRGLPRGSRPRGWRRAEQRVRAARRGGPRRRRARRRGRRAADSAAARTAAGPGAPGALHRGARPDCARRLRREAEADLVKLSLAIARRVLRRELAVDPDALHGLVLAALEKLEAQEIRARPRPPFARRRCGTPACENAPAAPASRWCRIASREPGAVVFETERGNLDASVDSQLAGDRARPGRPPAEAAHERTGSRWPATSRNSNAFRPCAGPAR